MTLMSYEVSYLDKKKFITGRLVVYFFHYILLRNKILRLALFAIVRNVTVKLLVQAGHDGGAPSPSYSGG